MLDDLLRDICSVSLKESGRDQERGKGGKHKADGEREDEIWGKYVLQEPLVTGSFNISLGQFSAFILKRQLQSN